MHSPRFDLFAFAMLMNDYLRLKKTSSHSELSEKKFMISVQKSPETCILPLTAQWWLKCGKNRGTSVKPRYGTSNARFINLRPEDSDNSWAEYSSPEQVYIAAAPPHIQTKGIELTTSKYPAEYCGRLD